MGASPGPGHRRLSALDERAQGPPHRPGRQEGQVDRRDVGRLHRRLERAEPGAQALEGPRPSRASSTTRTPAGRPGSSWPGALTTTTVPAAAPTRPATWPSSVDPCHSRPALGVPIREERPPARTIPAVSPHGHDAVTMPRVRDVSLERAIDLARENAVRTEPEEVPVGAAAAGASPPP